MITPPEQFTSLRITGMSCGHCTAQVKAALEDLDDVLQANVSLSEQTASIRMAKQLSTDVLTSAVKEAGYQAVPND